MKANPKAGLPGRKIDPFLVSAPATELKDLIAEATRSLALLDADRLEELAACCTALSGRVSGLEPEEQVSLRRQSAEAAQAMAVFGRVLEATRANLNLLRRLQEPQGGLEYSESQARGWVPAEVHRGDH